MIGLERITPKQLHEVLNNAKLPQLEHIEARDHKNIYFRHYAAGTNIVLVLLHGVAEDNKYLFRLAEYFSKNNIAQVYTPNLRGYGDKVDRRGDVDYIGQIEDDLADFLEWVKSNNPDARIILGGHSFGGASTLRFSGSTYNHFADGYIFISPYIPSAPYIKRKGKGHSKVSYFNFATLTILDKFNIQKFHHRKVYSSYKEKQYQHGGEAIKLSYRLAMSRIPNRYKDKISTIQKPALAIVGGDDELYHVEKFEQVFQHNPNFTTKVIPHHNHDGILFSNETYKEIEKWLQNIHFINRISYEALLQKIN